VLRHRLFRKLLLGGLAAGVLSLAFASSAAAYEWDIAKRGSYPGGLKCTQTYGSKACFQSRGEKIWVKDTKSDDRSALAYWTTPLVARSGYCRNRFGAGKWGFCNKRFQENIFISWSALRYDKESNTVHGPVSARVRKDT
jgi:hypothetical protein